MAIQNATTDEAVGPQVLIWLVTARCNLACSHCYAARFQKRGELSAGEAGEVVRQAAHEGATHLSLCGGEPFLRPDTLALIQQAREVGMTVSAVSNGSFITDRLARFLAATSARITLSLDGDRETHDAVRGQGKWEMVVAAAGHLRRHGVGFSTVMALSQVNYQAVPAYLETARELGTEAACLIPVMPTGRAKQGMVLSPGQIAESLRKAEETAERLNLPVRLWCTPFARLVTQSPLITSWGTCRHSPELNIGPSGDVFLCDILDYVLANVRDDGVPGAWAKRIQHPLIKKLARPELREPCLGCPIGEECLGGCYARAELMSGDLFAPDPLCPRAAARSG